MQLTQVVVRGSILVTEMCVIVFGLFFSEFSTFTYCTYTVVSGLQALARLYPRFRSMLMQRSTAIHNILCPGMRCHGCYIKWALHTREWCKRTDTHIRYIQETNTHTSMGYFIPGCLAVVQLLFPPQTVL